MSVYKKKRKVKFQLSAKLKNPIDVMMSKVHQYLQLAEEQKKELIKLKSLAEYQKEGGNGIDPKLRTLVIETTKLIVKYDELAVDFAHKAAPYISPKLESIEVKSKVEHKMVLRAPQQMDTVEEWAAKTGAEQINAKEVNQKKTELVRVAPSIHDYDELDDEIKTHRELLN